MNNVPLWEGVCFFFSRVHIVPFVEEVSFIFPSNCHLLVMPLKSHIRKDPEVSLQFTKTKYFSESG
jgi:hypothetical protein